MRLSFLGAVIIACALAGGAASETPSYVITGDAKIGRFETWEDGKLASAIRTFSRPTTIKPGPPRHYVCDVRWRPIGLRITFYVLGGSADACEPEQGCFRNALITGQQWRTLKGLQIGDTGGRVARLYPEGKSKRRGAWWPLLIRPFPEELGGPYPALEAKVHRGHVTAFRTYALTCGI